MTLSRLILIPLCTFLLTVADVNAEGITLPNIGDSGGSVSPADEYRTGEAVIRNIRRAGLLLDDPLAHSLLNDIAFKLVAANTDHLQPFQFFMIKDKDINAFALPGGFIGVNSGLVLAAHTESELAGVMAHEIAHITQRHHARQYEQNTGSVPIVAALIAAMILGSKNNEVGQAALATVAAGTAQAQINFTRENETEADHFGMELLTKAGFDPYGMPSFFETLDKQSRVYGESIPEFLRSHPVTPARIADSRNRASQYPRKMYSNSLGFHLLRVRLQVLTEEDTESLIKQYKAELSAGNYFNAQATRYGYALALLKNEQYREARKQIAPLLKQQPESIAYHLLEANIESAAGNLAVANKVFENSLKLYPGNLILTRYYAENLLKTGEVQHAQKLLQNQLRNSSNEPDLYRLLAEAEAKLQHAVQSHKAMAEYYYLIGQTHEAITQLKLGLKQPKIDFYHASQLEARLLEFQTELKELEKP